ncbi:hypothetical protein ACK3SF_03390 [Candidatus Nanosalina sp. VS9-1]|uniref:hypothetical protein n=1 Tax=Candidatus Nanosalina sp. VS9-1 TaxID=3388566 RepID=UPI0039E140EF
MKIESGNQGLKGWYDGALKKSAQEDDFELHQDDNYALIPDASMAEEAWKDIRNTGLDVIVDGVLHMQEFLTGGQRFELGQVDRTGIVLDDNYAGRKIGVSGYDLVFFDGEDERVYSNSSLDELENEMYGWFNDEQADAYMQELKPLIDRGNWPWTE